MKRNISLIMLVAVLSLCCFNKVQAEVLFQDDFEDNTTVSTSAWPDDPNDYDPDNPAAGTWSFQEGIPSDIQVTSYVGGSQPSSVASGSNYLIAGFHNEIYGNWDHPGRAIANWASPVNHSVIDFWVWGWDNMHVQVMGKELASAGGEEAFYLLLLGPASVGEVAFHNGSSFVTLDATWDPNSWNHVVIDLNLLTDSHDITINSNPTETVVGSFGSATTLGSIRFEGDNTTYYDNILIESSIVEPTMEIFDDDFESNTTVSTAAWPDSSGDYDPDNPAMGSWSISEDWDEGVQVSSYTGGTQPTSAHSGDNYLIAGYHGDYDDTFNHSGLATAEFSSSVGEAVVDFWVWGFSGQYGIVHGRDLHGLNERAFELLFWDGFEVKYDGVELAARLTNNAWNHIVVDLDLVNDTAGVTINSEPTEFFTAGDLTDVIDTLLFRDEYTGYYDDILVSIGEPNTVEPALVSYYPFNGTLEDTVGSYDGTIMPSGEPNYVAGPYALGQALLLDGSKYVDIGYGQPKGEVMRNGSVSLWFNIPGDPNIPVQYKMFFGTFNDGVSEGIWAGVTTDNLIDFEIRNGGGANVSWDNARENISSDTWYFYTATWGINSLTGNLDINEYVNGVLNRSGIQTDLGAISWQYSMVLGAGNSRGSVEDYFIGALDDIKFFNYPLSAAEVQQEYINATGIPICVDPPVADFTGDCIVDLNDLARLASEWLLDGNLYPM